MASKIPNHIQKFRGDNLQSFKDWIAQFEAHITALNIANDKKIPTLLCCIESTAFSVLSEFLAANDQATYAQAKEHLTTRFCGDDYKRNLQIKLQGLRFQKGTNINTFVNELTTTIKDLYNITDSATIRTIALNHVTANLEDSLSSEAKIFQLSGNDSLENLLEFLSTKMSMGSFGISTPVASSSFIKKQPKDDRIDKLEDMMKIILNKLDEKPSQDEKKNNSCNYCGKTGHIEEKCFKKKTCHICKQKGHIARYCRDRNKNEVPNAATRTKESISLGNKEKASRTILKINVGNQKIDFLYDTGSQYSIMKKETYDSLENKPPLNPVTQSGIGIDGHSFGFDGIVYLNLTFNVDDGEPYTLEYEPILVSSKVTSNIFGAQTENRFKTCSRDLEKSELKYTTKEHDKKINVRCYKENVNSTSAFIEVAKVSFIRENDIKVIKGKVRNIKSALKEDTDLFEIAECLENYDKIEFNNMATDHRENA